MRKSLFGFGFLLLGGFFGVINTQEVEAQKIPTLELFYGAECPHCHTEKSWLPKLVELYPNINIQEYEVWHSPENSALMQKRLKEIDATSTGVPTNIIGTDVVVGFSEARILSLMEKYYGAPVSATEESPEATESVEITSSDAPDAMPPSTDLSVDAAENKKLFFIFGGVAVFAIIGAIVLFGGNKK